MEIGCDCGATLLAVKNQFPHAYAYECDICKEAVAVAEHFADNVFTNNIEEESISIPEDFTFYEILNFFLNVVIH